MNVWQQRIADVLAEQGLLIAKAKPELAEEARRLPEQMERDLAGAIKRAFELVRQSLGR